MVIESRHGQSGLQALDLFLCRAEFEFIAVDRKQAYLARHAFSRFGKGRHRAGLNFGDCFSYALAMFLGEALLCKGGDFPLPDPDSFVSQPGVAIPWKGGCYPARKD